MNSIVTDKSKIFKVKAPLIHQIQFISNRMTRRIDHRCGLSRIPGTISRASNTRRRTNQNEKSRTIEKKKRENRTNDVDSSRGNTWLCQ